MSTFKEFLKQKFNETRFGILLKKSLEQNTIDTEWGEFMTLLMKKEFMKSARNTKKIFFPTD